MNSIDEMKATDVEELSSNVEYWLLIGRYSAGEGPWFSALTLRRNKIDAEHDLQGYRFAEARLVKFILPR